MGLSVWDKPSCSCLLTRFPYDTSISAEDLKRVERAEEILKEYGFSQVRVRCHGEIARIEVGIDERRKFFNERVWDEISEKIKGCGFSYASVELSGYVSGSMDFQ